MFNLFKRSKKEDTYVNISNRNVVRIVIIVVVSYIFLIGLRKISGPVKLILISIFLSLAINEPVHKLSHLLPGKLRGNRLLGISISLVLVLGILTIFLASIVPPLISQTENFIKVAPNLVHDLHNQDSSIGRFINHYQLTGQIDSISTQLGNSLKTISSKSFSTITDISSSIFSVLTVLVLTFMILIEGPRWLSYIHYLIDDSRKELASKISKDMYGVIKGYVNGQVLMAFIASIIIVIPLLVLNVSYPMALMVLVFICAVIPLVGHTIGFVIVTTVSLFHSPLTALIVGLYYILYMQIEAYVIQPKIQSSKTNLTPLMVFVSLLIGLSLDGLIGGLMAIPIAGCIKVLVEEFLVSRGYKTK
ncbi:MAG: AI-2E family transporter [bacterium]